MENNNNNNNPPIIIPYISQDSPKSSFDPESSEDFQTEFDFTIKRALQTSKERELQDKMLYYQEIIKLKEQEEKQKKDSLLYRNYQNGAYKNLQRDIIKENNEKIPNLYCNPTAMGLYQQEQQQNLLEQQQNLLILQKLYQQSNNIKRNKIQQTNNSLEINPLQINPFSENNNCTTTDNLSTNNCTTTDNNDNDEIQLQQLEVELSFNFTQQEIMSNTLENKVFSFNKSKSKSQSQSQSPVKSPLKSPAYSGSPITNLDEEIEFDEEMEEFIPITIPIPIPIPIDNQPIKSFKVTIAFKEEYFYKKLSYGGILYLNQSEIFNDLCIEFFELNYSGDNSEDFVKLSDNNNNVYIKSVQAYRKDKNLNTYQYYTDNKFTCKLFSKEDILELVICYSVIEGQYINFNTFIQFN